jgi:hypothetical protein
MLSVGRTDPAVPAGGVAESRPSVVGVRAWGRRIVQRQLLFCVDDNYFSLLATVM